MNPNAQPLNVLLLADDNPSHAAVVLDHIEAIRASRHRVTSFNPIGIARTILPLQNIDVIVIHWSLVVSWDSYIASSLRKQIREFEGLKVQFIQDEHRWVNKITSVIADLGVDVLFSVLPPATAQLLYSKRLPGTEVVTTLTGFVSDSLLELNSPPASARPIDIGYRGREIPYWMGRQTYEKVAIGKGVLERAPALGLTCDIAWSEEARIYGDQWLRFLESCRSCLGTPSGASIADFDGEVERSVREFLRLHPDADFPEVARGVLAPFEGNVEIDVVSPRIFEAAATRTALVLFPGSYSNLIRPGIHFLALERDFSNLPEIAEQIRDATFIDVLTTRAHSELIASRRFGYAAFTKTFDDIIGSRHTKLGKGQSRPKRRLTRLGSVLRR